MLVFSTHAFTEGDVLSSFFGWLYAISTHAFTEGDGVQLKRKFYWKRISTHAFTEGDISAPRVLEYECISTHAFTEGDVLLEIGILACNHFNSRLHGRRPVEKRGATISELFQLTPSRKATANSNNFCCKTLLIFINSFQISHSSFSFSPSFSSLFSSSCHFSGANLPVFFCLFTFRTRNMYTLS